MRHSAARLLTAQQTAGHEGPPRGAFGQAQAGTILPKAFRHQTMQAVLLAISRFLLLGLGCPVLRWRIRGCKARTVGQPEQISVHQRETGAEQESRKLSSTKHQRLADSQPLAGTKMPQTSPVTSISFRICFRQACLWTGYTVLSS